MSSQFIAVGKNGNVYTSDALGLYALSKDGDLLWFSPGSGGGHPIGIGANGTVYCGVTQSAGPEILRALGPTGEILWTYAPPVSWSVVAGPNVGPDGRIYAAQESTGSGGLGVFALEQDGTLAWSNVGEPELGQVNAATSNSEIVFAGDRLYVGIVRLRSGGNAVTYAFRYADGQQLWYTGTGGLGYLFSSFPRTDPRGRAIGRYGQTGMQAIDAQGNLDWRTLHPNANLLQVPAVDSAGNVFAGDLISVDLWSLDPDGNPRWALPTEQNAGAYALGVSPGDLRLVVTGSDGDGWVRGYRPQNGQLLWQVDLPREQGWGQFTTNPYPAFNDLTGTSDRKDALRSNTVYVTTRFGNVQEVDHGFLHAIDSL